MGVVPSQDQVMGQLRIIIPALGTIVSAVGVSSGDVSKWENIAMISVGPISYIVVGIWSLVANSRESIMKAAAKPVDASTPAPQIILPPQEKALAAQLPDNVTAAAPRAVRAVGKVLLIAFVLSAFLAIPSAQARGKKPAMTGNPIADIKTDLGLNQGPVKLTGNVDKDAQAIWDKIVAASQADLAYASKMAAVAGAPQIGRAAGRGRGEISGVAGSLKKKKKKDEEGRIRSKKESREGKSRNDIDKKCSQLDERLITTT